MKRKENLKITTLVLAALMLIITTPQLSSAASQFSDVKKGSEHYDGIMWLAENGIKGYEDGTFGKYIELSREHAAIMFVKVLDLNVPAKREVVDYFNDVDAEYEYADYIAAVAKEEIFKGEDGKFNPRDEMTREQMATTIVNAYDFESDGNVDVNIENVGTSHKKNVQILADLGITNQLDDFRPRETITRRQFATFLYESNKVHTGEVDEDESDPEPNGPTEKSVTKKYDYTFSSMINKQMKVSPQTDSAGTWYDASKSLVEYYVNSNNFKKNTKDYYQFLRLSGSAGISNKELNDKILKGKGVLAGKAADFKKASQTHNVNEIY